MTREHTSAVDDMPTLRLYRSIMLLCVGHVFLEDSRAFVDFVVCAMGVVQDIEYKRVSRIFGV